MERGKKGTKKDEFEALPQDFKDAVSAAGLDELKGRLSDVAKAEEENQSAKKADADLNDKKELAKLAASGYVELTKLHKLKRKFIIRNLADKGDPVAQNIVNLDAGAGK